jgi:signal peptidase I
MDLAKQLITYVVMIALLWAGLHYLPYLSRANVSSEYIDITVPDVDKYPSYALDPFVTINHLAHDDVVMFRKTGGTDAPGNFFGWVVALPGETVRVKDNQLLVNDQPVRKDAALRISYRPDAGPILVPAGTVWVATSLHMTDSLAIGPVPAAAIKGKVANFP